MKWTIFILALLMIYPVFGLELTSPINKVYNTTYIDLSITHNESADISYKVDQESIIDACANCTEYNTTLNLTQGNHTIAAYILNESVSVDFTILISFVNDTPVNVTINQTTNTTVNQTTNTTTNSTTNVTINATTNVTTNTTTNQTTNTTINQTSNVTTNHTTNITKNNTGNYTKNETPRFTTGFEKLPKLFESGNITDHELALIIRNNNLNPGILNRLIKTGKLGNESLDAILDTKFKPPSIWFKLFKWIGVKDDSYANQIAERYDLPEKLEEKISARSDLGDKIKEKVKIKVEEKKQKASGRIQSQGKGDANSGRDKILANNPGKSGSGQDKQQQKIDNSNPSGKENSGNGKGNGKGNGNAKK